MNRGDKCLKCTRLPKMPRIKKSSLSMEKAKLYSIIILSLIFTIGCSDAESITAFKNVNLVPMTAEKIIENQTVLVIGDRITDIGPADKIKIPKNAVVIDGKGAYLMPGLADMHVHLRDDWPLSQLDMYLANGVTTVRDLDGREFMLKWRDEIKAGIRSGPTIYATSPTIRGYEKDIPDRVHRNRENYDGIKLYSYFSKKDYQEAMRIARKEGIYTIGHIPFAVGLDGIIAERMNEIAHIEELVWELIDIDRTGTMPPQKWWQHIILAAEKNTVFSRDATDSEFQEYLEHQVNEVVAKLKQSDITVCTTLAVVEGIVAKMFQKDQFLARPESIYLPQTYLRALRKGDEKHLRLFREHDKVVPAYFKACAVFLTALQDAGISIVLGTDAGTGSMGIVPGFSMHDELRLATANGMSPFEAIAACTRNASRVVAAMTGKNEFGTIEVGKRADFILVNKNPMVDVAHIKDSRGVMVAGRWLSKPDLRNLVDPTLLPTISMRAGLFHIHQPDGKLETHLEIVIDQDFSGRLPDDIDAITVSHTDPAGNTTELNLPPYRYFEHLRDFWFAIDGPPALGKYTFTVKSKGRIGRVVDYQSVNRKIPIPDPNHFSPGQGATLKSKTPAFRWDPVDDKDSRLYYRIVINELQGKRVFSSGRGQAMLSVTIPEDILKPGKTYRWQLRVSDSEDWTEMQNRSQSNWMEIKMAEKLE